MIIVKVYGDGELLTILYYELEFDLSSPYLVVPKWSRSGPENYCYAIGGVSFDFFT